MAVDAVRRPLRRESFTAKGRASGQSGQDAGHGRSAAGRMRAARRIVQELALAERADAFTEMPAGEIDLAGPTLVERRKRISIPSLHPSRLIALRCPRGGD